MENYIDIQYISNLINLGYPSNYLINQFEIIKSKIILLLSGNDLIIIDSKRNNHLAQRHFVDKIIYIKVYKDNLFTIRGSNISLINQETCEEQTTYNIGEQLYLFAFCENKTNINGIKLIYVNYLNEIKYYSKGLLEAQYKKLYKENMKIDTLIYQKGILLWSTHETVKVFQLEKKQMLLKKTFRENTKIIECLLFQNILCINVNQTDIYAYQLPIEEDNVAVSYELIHIKTENKFEYIIGMWINSGINKISVLLHDSHVKLKIYIINQKEPSSANDILFTNDFKFISSSISCFRFYFSAHSSFVYLYNHNEIFYVTLLEKSQKMFIDIENNNLIESSNTIDLIYNHFSSFNINEKQYLLCKLIRKRKIIVDFNEEKYFYLVNSLYTTENLNKIPNGLLTKMFNYYIMILIQIKEIEFCYYSIKDKFNNYLVSLTKEKLVEYLVKSDIFSLLLLFINEINTLELTKNIAEIFHQEKLNEKAIYVYAKIQKKNFKYVRAIELLIQINRSDEIYQILSENNHELLFQFDNLFEILDELHLLNLLDSIYFKNSSFCVVFFNKLFKLCSKSKIARVSLVLISHDKYSLIPNISIAEELFTIILLNSDQSSNYLAFLLKFIHKYDKFNYVKLIESNNQSLMEPFNTELLIALLTKTKDYKGIINTCIDKLKDPEKCIKYIENTNIEDITKEEIYSYLTGKIKESKTLSVTKKFYFLCQFQDTINFKENRDNNLVEELNSSDEDDFDFLFLIIEQLKLKVKILEISGSISKNIMKQQISKLKRDLKIGKSIVFEKIFSCSCNTCENKNFNNEDIVICFQQCLHAFHKDCIIETSVACPICTRLT